MFLSSTATYVRFFSKKRSSNLRKINQRVPPQEAIGIAKGLYGIVKDHGTVTVSNTCNIAKGAFPSKGMSESLIQEMAKWEKLQFRIQGCWYQQFEQLTSSEDHAKRVRGRKLLKLFCTHVGSNKKFLHSVLAKESPSAKSNASSVPTVETAKPSGR